jgi:predicted Fe-Mo cluster-binding NifX family protein
LDLPALSTAFFEHAWQCDFVKLLETSIMKIAISACGENLEAQAHGLFGRCDYFVIVDTDTGENTVIKNDSAQAATGAGTGCAQTLFNHDVGAVVSGKVGPNAYEVLKAAGVAIHLTPPAITVKEALEKFKAGSLPEMQVQRF